MKLLLLSSTNNVRNGYGNITHELCSAYQKLGVEFTLLLPKDEPRYEYTTYNVEYVLPPYIFTFKTPKVLQYIAFTYNTDADIVHSLFEFPYALLGYKIARQHKKPFVIGSQGTYGLTPLFMWPEKYAVKYIYNRAQKFIVPSQYTKEAIEQESGTKTNIDIIHNGVNFSRFDKKLLIEDIRKAYPNKRLLLTVGGLKVRKGQDIVVKALSELVKQGHDVQYLLIGSRTQGGSYGTSDIEKLAQEHGVLERLTFLGEIDGDELVQYFQACDVYVHVPVHHNFNFEGFGIVYLEASACRRPIVAARSGGIPDAVIDGKTGIIVPENDPQATAEAIAHILESPKLALQLGEQGYDYARAHDWSLIAKQFVTLYEHL